MKTFKKIVVATDFSDCAKNAFHYARHLAVRFKSEIEVIHFFQLPINPSNPNYLDYVPTIDELEKSAEAQLSNFISEQDKHEGDTIVAHRIKLRTKVKMGFPAEGLIELSRDPSVDLLVLGTLGERGWVDSLFGSIAIAVAREANCPVLLVPQSAEYRGIHHIVYTSSFSSAKPREIRVALDFAKYFSAAIDFVHVVSNPNDIGISEKLVFRNFLEGEHTKVPYSIENVHAATPSEGINQYILKKNVDMLITVTHHQTFWQKLFYKSTTKDLAWNAHTPILVMHKEETEKPPV